MSRRRGTALVVIVLAAIVVGGVVVVALEARARVAAVHEQTARVADVQSLAADYTREFWSRPHIMRDAVTEAMMNDAIPVFAIEGDDASVSVSRGTLGGVAFLPTAVRPWTPPMATAPLTMGLVLAITATLVAASRWTPRAGGAPRREPAPEPARRGRPGGS